MKPTLSDLAVILLTAGEGQRFGGGKLEAELYGKMLGLHVAETLAGAGFASRVAVCSAANERLNKDLKSLGFELVINPDPANGQSDSLALGISQLADAKLSGAMIALADMPYISAGHLHRLVSAFDGEGPVCSTNGTVRMPPAIFPHSTFPDLQHLSGDQGARTLLRHAIAVEASPEMLADIDTPEDLPR